MMKEMMAGVYYFFFFTKKQNGFTGLLSIVISFTK